MRPPFPSLTTALKASPQDPTPPRAWPEEVGERAAADEQYPHRQHKNSFQEHLAPRRDFGQSAGPDDAFRSRID